MGALVCTEFGDPVLRRVSRHLTIDEIISSKVQELITDMHFTLTDKKLGVGLAANQVGQRHAVAVINIQKTELRPELEPFKLTIINPKIIRTFGNREQMWEGCISSGSGGAGLFAKVPRYKKIQLEYCDEKANFHSETFKGLQAHVIQHEVDHLNGVLFVDRVSDTKTYMTHKEYKRMKGIDNDIK